MFALNGKTETAPGRARTMKTEIHVLNSGPLLQVTDNADYRDLSSVEDVEERIVSRGYRLMPGSTPTIKTFEGDTKVVPNRFMVLVELGHQLFIVDGINSLHQYRVFMKEFGGCPCVLVHIVLPEQQSAPNNTRSYNLLRGY